MSEQNSPGEVPFFLTSILEVICNHVEFDESNRSVAFVAKVLNSLSFLPNDTLSSMEVGPFSTLIDAACNEAGRQTRRGR